ncbi:MAG: tetratricopeptide repeat protein [Desulfosalsimonadaceae bacterium]
MQNLQSRIDQVLRHPFSPWLAALLLIITTAAVYAPVRHHDFINFDDGGYVYENKQVQSGLTMGSIKWAFTLIKSDEKSYWHPVTWLSHMLDCQLFGINPGYHHLSNLFYHLMNVLLLFLVFFRMTGALWKSAVVAALFALHPVNVDSVAWIAERKNLLSTTFWLLTIFAYVCYAARPTAWRYLIVIAVFSMGLMAKPMLVTLPCVLLLLDFWPLFRSKWFRGNWVNRKALPPIGRPEFHVTSVNRLVIEKIPLLILSFGAIWLSFVSLQKNSHILNEIVQPFSLRIENALVSYLHYLWKMIWPLKLAVFYPFPTEIPIWQSIFAMVALIMMTIIVVINCKKRPYLLTGWLWYVGTLTPVIGIIQGGLWPQIADRWAYVPYVGLFILLAWGIPDFFSRFRFNRLLPAGLTLAILVIFLFLTSGQVKHWKDTDTLFQHALKVTKNNYLAHMQVGEYFVNKDDHPQAMMHFQKALSILPDFSEAHRAIGQEYVFLNDYDQALYHYQKALMFDPSNIDLFNKTGNVYALMDRYDQAIRLYCDAIAIDPDDPAAYNNLGAAYYFTGQMENATMNVDKALKLQPNFVEAYYNMGLIEAKTGNTDNAVNAFQKAIKLNPDYADAHNSLGKLFFQAGNLPAALSHFENVLRLSPEDASAHYNIGIILYTRKRMPEAIRHFQKALELKPGYEKAKIALQSARASMKKN